MYILTSIFIFILGLSVGSFLSVFIPRLKSSRKGIILGRSACPACKTKLKIFDLIPVLSFLLLKGKCRHCNRQISIFYPLIELSCGILFLLTATNLFHPFLENPSFLNINFLVLILFLLYITALIFIFFYDLLYLEISDTILIPIIVIAFFASFIPHPYIPNTVTALLGAAIPLSLFTVQILLSKGKWLGGGDLRIGAFVGLILGIKQVILALVLTYIIGAIIAIFLLVTKKAQRDTPIPFGPFLVSGTILSLFYGKGIIEWYLNDLLLLM